jgi:hypothetical protein
VKRISAITQLAAVRSLAPSLVGIAVVLIHVALIVRAALAHTGGEFSYAIDDAYIHLALAKHIAFDGVHGVTRYAFSAASSSVLWPLLLAGAMRVFGDRVVLPLFLNLAAAIALVLCVGRALDREARSISVAVRTFVVVAIVMLVPVATLTAVGMEHVLHATLTVAFVLEAARVVGDEKTQRDARFLAPLATALVATRYEGIFPVGIVVALLAIRRRVGVAALVAAAGAAPIVLFGAYSIAHGSLFLPNSIALKRRHLDLDGFTNVENLFGGTLLDALSTQSYLLPLGFGTCALLAGELWRRRAWNRNVTRLTVALGTTLAHIELASLGWFYRYEAYLIALDLTVIALAVAPVASTFSLRKAWRQSPLALLAGTVAVAVGTAPLWVRAFKAQGATPLACANIHDQQVQTARFLARYFPHDLVAVNDIGAVAYYGDEPILDLEGLASLTVARAKSYRIDRPLNVSQLASLAKDAPVAVVYEEWFPQLPKTWVRVGRLRIDSNIVCASNAVAVYATSGANVPRVLDALVAFGPSLPAEVRRDGVWIEQPPQERARWRADAGDVLSVDVDGSPEVTAVAEVDAAGSLWLPKVGEVRVRGMELSEIAAAIRETAARHDVALPGHTDVHVALVDERRCHVIVMGNVGRVIDERAECGTPAGKLLARAGWRRAEAVDPYIWRREGGSLRRIALDYDPTGDAEARDIGLKGDDIVVVE